MTNEQLLQIAADHVGKLDGADLSELDLITTERSELIAFGHAVEAELKKANTQTPDDILPGPLSETELREQWNAQADEFNQWDSLDSDEQFAWAQKCAIPAHEAALAAERPAPGPTIDDIWQLCEDHEFHLGMDGANEEESAEGLLEIINTALGRWGRPASVQGWQPINTAPQDGTEILASDYDAIEIVSWSWDAWERGSGWIDRNGQRMFPAWWQPLQNHPPIPQPFQNEEVK